ncbi:MAG: hypothetical protein KBD31_03720 [Proteobacteria bacterium]|nr:hypothetical protein [Pseudomonadota bacterium]
MPYSLIFILFFIHYAFSSVALLTETGEICTLNESLKYPIIRTSIENGVAYTEDSKGDIRAYSVDENNTLTRINMYRLPLLGSLYHFLFENHFSLKEKTHNNLSTWAMSRAIYEDGSTTVSLFEMISHHPIIIRNRDPWLNPYHLFTHVGPFGMYGIHITAIDQWIAISGYSKNSQTNTLFKSFAFKRLTYDLAGHNFMMDYCFKTHSGAIEQSFNRNSNRFYKFINKKMGISQKRVDLPVNNWSIFALPEDSGANITLKKYGENDIKIIIPQKDSQEKPAIFFDVFTKSFVPYTDDSILFIPSNWPILSESIAQSITYIHSQRVLINGKAGYYYFSDNEPNHGHVNINNQTIEVFKIVSGPWDFFTNQYTYCDSNGKKLNLKFMSENLEHSMPQLQTENETTHLV